MKTKDRTSGTIASITLGLILVFICAFPASAAENTPSWRPTYDLIMMWVNFLILFGVLYKFLKTPLADFIQGKKYEMEKELNKAEEQKQLAQEKIQESLKMLEEGEDRFNKIKERIVAQGEAQKAKIIEEAQNQSQYMLTEAKRKIDSQIVRAKEKFRMQLVDRAFDLALQRLPGMITKEDSDKFVEDYIKNAIPG